MYRFRAIVVVLYLPVLYALEVTTIGHVHIHVHVHMHVNVHVVMDGYAVSCHNTQNIIIKSVQTRMHMASIWM